MQIGYTCLLDELVIHVLPQVLSKVLWGNIQVLVQNQVVEHFKPVRVSAYLPTNNCLIKMINISSMPIRVKPLIDLAGKIELFFHARVHVLR